MNLTYTHVRPLERTSPFHPYRSLLNGLGVLGARALCVYLVFCAHALIANAQQATADVPLFRQVDASAVPVAVPANKLRLLTDADFPPFSFTGADGRAMGLSVDLALAACENLKISCKVETRSFGELVPALQRDEGDMIISGVRLNEKLLSEFGMTRPYFWSFGRFAAQSSFAGTKADAKSLDGISVGVVGGSAHEAWLTKYYPKVTVQPFKSEAELFSGLKSGQVPVIFGDDMRISFWLSGAAAGSCCRTLGGSFVDRAYFSHSLVFLTKHDSGQVIKSFDAALDHLQQSGVTTKLMQRYLPHAFW